MSFTQMSKPETFNVGTAFAIRTACAWVGHDRHAEMDRIATAVAAIINSLPSDPAARIGEMRKLGGYTVMIRRELEECPSPDINKLGFCTNPAWYRWQSLYNSTDDIRHLIHNKIK